MVESIAVLIVLPRLKGFYIYTIPAFQKTSFFELSDSASHLSHTLCLRRINPYKPLSKIFSLSFFYLSCPHTECSPPFHLTLLIPCVVSLLLLCDIPFIPSLGVP